MALLELDVDVGEGLIDALPKGNKDYPIEALWSE